MTYYFVIAARTDIHKQVGALPLSAAAASCKTRCSGGMSRPPWWQWRRCGGVRVMGRCTRWPCADYTYRRTRPIAFVPGLLSCTLLCKKCARDRVHYCSALTRFVCVFIRATDHISCAAAATLYGGPR